MSFKKNQKQIKATNQLLQKRKKAKQLLPRPWFPNIGNTLFDKKSTVHPVPESRK